MKLKPTIFLLSIGVLIVSCGRETGNSDRNSRDFSPRVQLSEFASDSLNAQSVGCESSECDKSIVKLNIAFSDRVERCLGVHLGQGRVLTAGSCIPSFLRVRNTSCSNEIVVSAIGARGSFNSVCTRIESYSTSILREVPLWDDDLAVIFVAGVRSLPAAKLSLKGLALEEDLMGYGLKRSAPNQDLIVPTTCGRVINTYANPININQDSSFQVFTDCDEKLNLKGAAFFNRSGELVAIGSKRVDNSIIEVLKKRNFLQNTERVNLMYASNLGCSKFRENNYEAAPENCLPNIFKDSYALSQAREKILQGGAESIKLQQKIVTDSFVTKHNFKWRFELKSEEDSNDRELVMTQPECFLDVDKWIAKYTRRKRKKRICSTVAKLVVSIEGYKVQTKLDDNLSPSTKIIAQGTKSFHVKINPYEAYIDRSTPVYLKTNNRSRSYDITFRSVSECKRP